MLVDIGLSKKVRLNHVNCVRQEVSLIDSEEDIAKVTISNGFRHVAAKHCLFSIAWSCTVRNEGTFALVSLLVAHELSALFTKLWIQVLEEHLPVDQVQDHSLVLLIGHIFVLLNLQALDEKVLSTLRKDMAWLEVSILEEAPDA